ncbi:MAG: alkaline phosphatase, partial [Thermoleophilaceae bacterium]|nr:alkaline phosphatase [Thermoleophilaceae bacterium]
VRIAFFSCQDWQAGYFTSHADILKQDVDLMVCLGDYIYERNYYEGPRSDTLGKNHDGEVETLAEYREKYALYHTDRNLRDIRAEIPIVPVWDDHEVEDNWAGKLPGTQTQDPRISFLKRRRNGFQTFFEHHPVMQDPKDPDRIYDSLRMGRNFEMFLLDERQYRSDQPCNDTALVPCPPEQRDDPTRTLLGKRQTSWLKRALRRSDAVWKGIANQVMIMSVDLPVGNPINPDQWDGYGANRSELLGYIHDKGISDVAFITGDIHTFFAGDVSRTGRQSVLGKPDAVATEFVCGSVTSLGLLHVLQDQTGVGLPPDVGTLAGDGALIPVDNPHFVYSNLIRHGYGLVTANSDELRVDYRSPKTTQTKGSPVNTIASFTVERGTPHANLL